MTLGLTMRRFRFAALAIAAALAGVAVEQAAAAPIYNWTGFYLGLNGGYGWGSGSTDFCYANFGCPFTNLSSSTSPNPKGGVFGLQGGYNYQLNATWLVGIEADIDYAHINGSSGSIAPDGAFLQTAEQDIKWLGTVRARLGALPMDRLLAFATGGVAFGEVSESSADGAAPPFAFCAPINSCGSGSASGTNVGWTVGAGAEYALPGNFTLKAEYLYVDLGHKSVTYPVTLSTVLINANGAFRANIARLGVNYRF
jgi:outer membrane immunogenic protein